MDRLKSAGGFTLLELIIIVGIIGVLAAVAIPQFMKYRTKAKQAEAKLILKAIYTTELAYYTENNFYTGALGELEWWKATGVPVYRYSVGGGEVGNPDPGGSPMNNAPAAAGSFDFTAIGWSNIDNDLAVDTWQSTSKRPLDNVYDDVKEKSPL